jgi:endoglucanase
VRPLIRINQLGYLPPRTKRATWISDAREPADFAVRAADGAIVFRGRSTPWPTRPDPTSGQNVHVLDFTPVTDPGTYHLTAGSDRSHPFRVAADLYDPLARDALHLFYLLRSGCPIDERRAPGFGRPAGHLSDRAVPAWSGPDAARLYPGWTPPPGTFDVSGGWYDAGDYGKYVVSGSVAVWQLLSILDLPGAPRETLIEECRWQLDWLLRMQNPADGLVFHRVHGTEWSPIPGLPHEDPTRRVLHRPSTTATLHLAAVAAQASRLLRAADGPYAERLLTAARTAWRAANDHPDLIAPDDEGAFGGGPYGDPDPADDFFWAGTELWLATGEERYRRPVPADDGDLSGFDFHRVAALARIDLGEAQQTAEELQKRQPWGQPYAPEGGWDWGSNGRILNNLVVLATAGSVDAVATGMDYLLGRNALGQSYVTGYGTDTPRRLRTRQFGPGPLPPGAIAGGANSTHTPGFPSDPRLSGLPPQLCYLDEPTSETTNDICIRWNAPLAFIAVYLSAQNAGFE